MEKAKVIVAQVVIGLILLCTWWWINGYVGIQTYLSGLKNYILFFSQGAALLFLLPCIIIYNKYLPSLKSGNAFSAKSIAPLLFVILIYVIEYAYSLALGQENEPILSYLFTGTFSELIPTYIAVLIFAPIANELIFRGLLLNIFSTKETTFYWIASITIAAIFTYLHMSQYIYISTFVEIFCLALIFSWARLRTGGLLLPILLHFLASLLGFVTFYLR